jgi:predicted aspartyl protease
MHKLEFSHLIEYNAGDAGITVSASLKLIGKTIDFVAKVDTGATNCVFERRLGEELGLNIEAGLPKRIGTATSSFLTYEHEVTMTVLDFDFDVLACFAADEAFQRNILGRHGFLMQIKLGLVDYEGKLYLERLF